MNPVQYYGVKVDVRAPFEALLEPQEGLKMMGDQPTEVCVDRTANEGNWEGGFSCGL